MFVNTPEQLAENKLLLLYILSEFNMPLTNTQLTEFVLENDIMNYFMLQQFLSELNEADFIVGDMENPNQLISITKKGIITLNYFLNRISNSYQEKVTSLVNLKKESLKPNTIIKSKYKTLLDNSYMVYLSIVENDIPIINLKFNIKDKEKAKYICKKWNEDALNISNNIFNLFD
ncbi:MAG: DUF4364 family protein [Clostridiales bacterium]|nr:DUF4364 family protein [Clostridiales bacterium]